MQRGFDAYAILNDAYPKRSGPKGTKSLPPVFAPCLCPMSLPPDSATRDCHLI